MTTEPSVLIPIAPGTNRNDDIAEAFVAAGASVAQYPLQALRSGETKLTDHQILALPGGFSYGDALGAGRLLGLDLAGWFADQILEANERSMPMIGVCNGFQALVNAGLLPGPDTKVDGVDDEPQPASWTVEGEKDASLASLTGNLRGRFECRWVHLLPDTSQSIWTRELEEPLRCPVAHGEGRFVAADLDALEQNERVAFRYCSADGSAAGGQYPINPNGSQGDVAGIVDSTGLILGMMPHPENHVFSRQDPQRRRGLGGNCLPLFKAGVAAVSGD